MWVFLSSMGTHRPTELLAPGLKPLLETRGPHCSKAGSKQAGETLCVPAHLLSLPSRSPSSPSHQGARGSGSSRARVAAHPHTRPVPLPLGPLQGAAAAADTAAAHKHVSLTHAHKHTHTMHMGAMLSALPPAKTATRLRLQTLRSTEQVAFAATRNTWSALPQANGVPASIAGCRLMTAKSRAPADAPLEKYCRLGAACRHTQPHTDTHTRARQGFGQLERLTRCLSRTAADKQARPVAHSSKQDAQQQPGARPNTATHQAK